mgnify:CR=1 FL=1
METEIILHRGYKGKHLENSRVAFENAIRECMSFETDIRVSKDGKCFLIHDEYLERLLGISGRVQDYNAERLRNMKYIGDSSSLVLFDELINLIKKNKENSGKIFIHIKQLNDIPYVMHSLDGNLKEKLRFFACDDITKGLVNLIRENYPGYIVGLHVAEDSPYKNEEHFKKADFIWTDEIKKKSINSRLVRLANSTEKPIYVISPELIPESVFNKDIQKRWREFVAMNVNGICTDKPIELMNFLRKN